MRVLAAWIVALGLAVSPAIAGTGGAGEDKNASAVKPDTSAAKDKTGTTADTSKADAPAKPAASGVENELQQLRNLLEAQAKQMQAQSEALKEQQRKMEVMEAQLKAVNASPNGLAAGVSIPAGGALGANPVNGSAALNNGAADEKKPDEPASIRFKGITITPGGFIAAETVYRNHGMANDVNTDFKGIPFAGASNGHLSEFNFSGRQSRISLLAEGKLDNMKLTGYYETDWLSAGVTSNDNQSNSYTLRQRQIWGQAALNSGWTFTGGQMWSLVTETKKGLNNRTEAAPLTIDAQYVVGFSWARQYGFRVTKSLGDKLWLGFSVEGPQNTLGGKIQTQNTLIAAPGDTAGLYNSGANYSFNPAPDFIFKAAWEPGWGHYEVYGILSDFRARIFPCASASVATPCIVDGSTAPSALGATNDSVAGGGIGGNARFSFFDKKLDVALHGAYGDGIGRYGTTGLSDVTVHPDGTLEPIRGGQALITIEIHPNPNWDFYGYGGGEYDARTNYLNAAGAGVGYGSPLNSNAGCLIERLPTNQNTPTAQANCQGDIRTIMEGTIGFWNRIYSGPKGKLQWGLQYSYATRNTWSANAGADPHGITNMVFTSFRYYIP
ncbi:MAG: hypothetical protein WBP79_02250 [Candidatus Acidiferrales bacterium]